MPQYYSDPKNPQGNQYDFYMKNDLGHGFHVRTVAGNVVMRSRDDELGWDKLIAVPGSSLPANVLEAFTAFLNV